MQVQRPSAPAPAAPAGPVSGTPVIAAPPPTGPVAPVGPAPAPDAPPAPPRPVGNAQDLQAIQSRIEGATSGELTAQLQKLESTTFANSASKFFHSLFGTDTYKSFQSAESVLRATHTARNEAMAAANKAIRTGAPEDLSHAKCLMAKSELIGASRSGTLSPTQLKAYKELDGSVEGRQILSSMSLLNSTEAANVRNNATADEIAHMDLSPINRGLVLQKSAAEREALAELHTEIFASPGFPESNNLLLSRDSLRSYAFEAFMGKKEFSPENPAFLLKAKELMENQPAPTMQDIRNLFASMIEGGTSHQGPIGEDTGGSLKINLPGEIYGPLKAAIDGNDYAGAVAQLGKAVKNISALMGNDPFKRFTKFEEEEPGKMKKFIEQNVDMDVQRYFATQDSLVASGLL